MHKAHELGLDASAAFSKEYGAAAWTSSPS